MYWYALFVKTGQEHKVLLEIDKIWKIEGIKPFVPVCDTHFRKAGRVYSEKRRLYPGYVFVEAEYRGLEFYELTHLFILRSEHALKLLRYGGKNYEGDPFEMNQEEYSNLLQLYNKEYCIEMSKGFMEGDSIYISDGPLKGFESRIKNINRHRMEAVVEIEMMGRMIDITVGLEIIEKLLPKL